MDEANIRRFFRRTGTRTNYKGIKPWEERNELFDGQSIVLDDVDDAAWNSPSTE